MLLIKRPLPTTSQPERHSSPETFSFCQKCSVIHAFFLLQQDLRLKHWHDEPRSFVIILTLLCLLWSRTNFHQNESLWNCPTSSVKEKKWCHIKTSNIFLWRHVRASDVVIKKTILGAVKNKTLTNEVENVSAEFKVICHIQSQWCTQKYILGGVTRHRKTKEGIACWAPKQYMSFFLHA